IRQAQTARFASISDLFDDHNHRLNEQARFQSFLEAAMVKFDWAMKTANIEAARATLPTLRANLDQLQSVTAEPPLAQNFFEAEYWTRMEQLARHEGRLDEAAEYLRAARNARSSHSRAANRPAAVRAEGRQLPPLRASSIGGRLFSDRNLDGKIALISVWATWCAPCISELAALQKLYEELKDTNDVVVLSLNIDANPGVVEPFLAGRNWTFPVLLAYDYVNRFLPDLSIPRTWIVDGSLIVSEDSGFDSAEAWRTRMLAKLAQARQRSKSGR
ncbi:MAG: redoxin domain-containing protein, partial [Bryobacterales bacterium]|nr:redoxin domain-containing protein [Bryobacterales bacterium]